jgi:hypothetical protein
LPEKNLPLLLYDKGFTIFLPVQSIELALTIVSVLYGGRIWALSEPFFLSAGSTNVINAFRRCRINLYRFAFTRLFMPKNLVFCIFKGKSRSVFADKMENKEKLIQE